MDLKKARVLLHAIDSGSLKAAAAAFSYTPSGVSHMMTALEEELGLSLLIRTKTGVLPTSAAIRLLPALRAQCSWDEQLNQIVADIKGLATGSITIAAYSSIASKWLPNVISAFLKEYPNISIKLLEGVWTEVENYISDRRADIGFYSYQPSIKHRWIPLKKDRMLLAVPADHPFAARESIRIDEIAHEKIIMPAFGSDVDVLNLLKGNSINIEPVICTMQSFSAMELVEQGVGLLITNELITLGHSDKIKLLPFDPPQFITLGMAVNMGVDPLPAVAKFMEYASAMIGGMNDTVYGWET